MQVFGFKKGKQFLRLRPLTGPAGCLYVAGQCGEPGGADPVNSAQPSSANRTYAALPLAA